MDEKVIAELRAIREELRALRLEMKSGRVSVSALVTRKEAARRLGVGPTKLRALIDSGVVMTTPLGRRRMVAVSEIERVAKTRSAPSSRASRAPSKSKAAPPDPMSLRRWARTQKG